MFNRTTLLILLVALATGAGLMAAEFVFNRERAPASAPPTASSTSTPGASSASSTA